MFNINFICIIHLRKIDEAAAMSAMASAVSESVGGNVVTFCNLLLILE